MSLRQFSRRGITGSKDRFFKNVLSSLRSEFRLSANVFDLSGMEISPGGDAGTVQKAEQYTGFKPL